MLVLFRKSHILLFLLLVTFLHAIHSQTTREEIIASREKRRIQLENVLQGIQKKLADHQSGTKPLKKNQLDHLEHKVNAYQHQIEELDRELDEDEIQRRLEQAAEIRKSKMDQEL